MFLLIDKPKGFTSHDVVAQIRKITKEQKVGHAGTLDPNATGLLIVGVGRPATKQLGNLAKNTTKVYEAEIYLGEEKDTDDVEGVTVSKAHGYLPPAQHEVLEILKKFKGVQMQKPPAFSAIKINGKKAYELARLGKTPKMRLRKVKIYSIEILSYHFPLLRIKTKVSSGTYVRALARDVGQRLGCGAYLYNLRRLAIGKLHVDDAVGLTGLTTDNFKRFLKTEVI